MNSWRQSNKLIQMKSFLSDSICFGNETRTLQKTWIRSRQLGCPPNEAAQVTYSFIKTLFGKAGVQKLTLIDQHMIHWQSVWYFKNDIFFATSCKHQDAVQDLRQDRGLHSLLEHLAGPSLHPKNKAHHLVFTKLNQNPLIISKAKEVCKGACECLSLHNQQEDY